MIRNKKAMLFCSQIVLTGALIIGAPCLAFGDTDLSCEGQIHKPAALDAPDFTSEPDFVDDSTDNTYGYYTVMGNTTVSLAVEYPSAVLGEGGASAIEDFCNIILEESYAEGVRGEVVFEQAMLETGWLQYGGDSGVSQYNFAGLGTTGGGVAGVSYPDVRTGIRAQVQHLKAYASDENLNQDCVDTRFDMVKRCSAPYVEWLGQKENPNGVGWAEGANYGAKLRKLLAHLKEQ